MVNVFLLYADHQFDGIKEAINYFDISKDKAIIFVFIQNNIPESSNNWVDKLNLSEFFKDVFIVPEWSIIKTFFRKPQSYKKFINHLKPFRSLQIRLFSSIYNSDSVNLIYNKLNPCEFIVTDDGNASFSVLIQRNLKKNISI